MIKGKENILFAEQPLQYCKGYSAIEFYKIFCFATFSYLYYIIKLLEGIQLAKILEGFKGKLKKWIKKRMILFKISKKSLDELIDSKESEVMWRILYCCYLANCHFRSNIKEYIKIKRIFIEKLSKLPESFLKKKKWIICQAIAKNWKNKRSKQKAFNILIYFILVINHKLSIFMVRKQEICNWRYLKSKIFKIF